jgi:hypothetical protein
MPARCFPPPWTIEDHNDACFIVRDKNGYSPAHATPAGSIQSFKFNLGLFAFGRARVELAARGITHALIIFLLNLDWPHLDRRRPFFCRRSRPTQVFSLHLPFRLWRYMSNESVLP